MIFNKTNLNDVQQICKDSENNVYYAIQNCIDMFF